MDVFCSVVGVRKGPKDDLGQEHDESIVANDHATGIFVSEIWVEMEPEFRAEVNRSFEVIEDAKSGIT